MPVSGGAPSALAAGAQLGQARPKEMRWSGRRRRLEVRGGSSCGGGAAVHGEEAEESGAGTGASPGGLQWRRRTPAGRQRRGRGRESEQKGRRRGAGRSRRSAATACPPRRLPAGLAVTVRLRALFGAAGPRVVVVMLAGVPFPEAGGGREGAGVGLLHRAGVRVGGHRHSASLRVWGCLCPTQPRQPHSGAGAAGKKSLSPEDLGRAAKNGEVRRRCLEKEKRGGGNFLKRRSSSSSSRRRAKYTGGGWREGRGIKSNRKKKAGGEKEKAAAAYQHEQLPLTCPPPPGYRKGYWGLRLSAIRKTKVVSSGKAAAGSRTSSLHKQQQQHVVLEGEGKTKGIHAAYF